MANSFTAACVTMRTGRDVARNRDDAVAMIREAASAGADFVQTPEMTNVLDRDRAALFDKVREENEDETLAALRDLARSLAIVIHAGSLAVKQGDKLANRGFMIGPDGEIGARYTKIHLFDVDLPNGESWRESRTYAGGDVAVVTETAWAQVGMTICYDVRFAALYRALAEAGASVLTAPACFTRQTGEAHWHILQRARAIETGSFMISAAQAGTHEDGRETFGHSLIVDPWGRILAEGGGEPGIVMARLELDRVADARSRIPALRNARPFTVEHRGVAPRALAAAE